jgi:Trpc4-associated protein
MVDVSNLLSVIQVAQSLGIAAVSSEEDSWLLSLLQMHTSLASVLAPRGRRTDGGRAGRPRSPVDARKELQFYAMLLAPHQVELLFVICTLLSGRRKIDVQQRLAALGLADVLTLMYGRLSWDSPPFLGPNPIEHIHGPGCECNPESALRVQYLRLVHNFYDRDFLGNANKHIILTDAEKAMLARCSRPEEAMREGGLLISITGKDRGLISRIMGTLLREPPESIYRFWLSSCLEAFLRGSGKEQQLFVALSGVMNHTVSHVVNMGVRPSVNLQTSFDLLGELVKGNEHTVAMLEAALADNRCV